MKKIKIAVVKCNDYDYKKIRKCLDESLKFLGGIENLIKSNEKILLKPNICNALPPEKADTTNPILLKAVIDTIKEYNKNIVIGESSAGPDPSHTDKAFQISGIKEISEITKTKLRNLSSEPYQEIEIPNAKVVKKTRISKAFFDFDVIINIPKLKTHNNTYLTGCVKNCFGLIEKKEREELHKIDGPGQGSFSQGIVDIYSVIKPKIRLNIMDAVVGMEGIGTPAGRPKKIGVILMGVDGVAVDSVASSIIGFKNTLEIPPTRFAYERGLGIATLNKIKLNSNLDDFRMKGFELPLSYTKKKDTKLIPRFNQNCIKCGLCEQICPKGAIKIGTKNKIDRSKCISCLCCFEICENNGIDLIEEVICKKGIVEPENCESCIYYLRKDCRGIGAKNEKIG
ncbi:MAG: DUF362 domain-containing protein [Nanoarchaeota archaeon]|nr:DUF362 domain-containing protein [Nanoarchaeota archaeon]